MRGIIVSKYDYKQFDYWNKCYINEHNLEYPYIEFIEFTGKGTVEIITYLIKKNKRFAIER